LTDPRIAHEIGLPPECHRLLANLREGFQAQGLDCHEAIVKARYEFVQDVCAQSIQTGTDDGQDISDRLDSILTHRVWGWAVFLGLMGLMFFSIFTLAAYPMDWIDGGFAWIGSMIKSRMPPGDLRNLITDGVVAGVGGVLVFLPQILILFFFIGLLEDTGYMARAAFIMDRFMSRVGLHGKSFIPLLSSYACAIPGIMATRTIENPKDRLVTILVAPLMSCSARLPVYTLMIATLLPATTVPALRKAGMMMALYVFGTASAFLFAWFFKRTLMRGETPVLIMELPPYRWPHWSSVFMQMVGRAKLFVKRAGTVILGLSILLWFLAAYPKSGSDDASAQLSQSFAGKLGHAIEPIIKPLGFDWKIGIGLVGSFAAREVFVSTMSIVYNVEESDDATVPLRESLLKEKWPDGRAVFTPLVCISLMVFYVLALQCISTIAVVKRETNGWRWPMFQLAYMTGSAYIASLVVYQVGRLIGY
jgi:ferrous iron transport protein B